MERCIMLDFGDLRAFARIADLASVSGAARSLRAPKSTVSRSLSRLEAAVGATLVERSTRQLRLTDAGLLLQRHARRILDDLGEAENALSGLIGRPSGDLRVSAPFTLAAGPLAPMLPAFLERYPEVRLILTVDNRSVDLLSEEIDVAIRVGPLPDSELIARRLASVELWLCASPDYVAARGVPAHPDDLRDHALIGHGHPGGFPRLRGPGGAVVSVDAPPTAIIPEPAVVKAMLIGGAGLGWLPDFHAADAVASGALVRVMPDFARDRLDVHALYPSHRSLSAKVRVFIDALVAHLGDRP